MLSAEISFLRSHFPNLPLHVLTDDPAAVSTRYGVPASSSDVTLLDPWAGAPRNPAAALPTVLRAPARFLRNHVTLPLQCRRFLRAATAPAAPSLPPSQAQLLSVLRRSRLILSGGGLMPSVPHIDTARRTLLAAAASLNIPYILNGQSIYRSDSPYAPYSNAHAILLRDPSASRSNALSCGVSPSRLIDSFDPVFCTPLPAASLAESLLADANPAREPFAAISLRPGLSNSALSETAAQLLRLADTGIISRFLLCGLQFHPTASDIPILSCLQSLLGPAAVVLPPFHETPVLLPALLSQARFTLAARYHAALFSLAAGTPAFGLSVSSDYSLKLSGAFESFHRPEWLLKSPNHLAAAVSNALSSDCGPQLSAHAQSMFQAGPILARTINEILS